MLDLLSIDKCNFITLCTEMHRKSTQCWAQLLLVLLSRFLRLWLINHSESPKNSTFKAGFNTLREESFMFFILGALPLFCLHILELMHVITLSRCHHSAGAAVGCDWPSEGHDAGSPQWRRSSWHESGSQQDSQKNVSQYTSSSFYWCKSYIDSKWDNQHNWVTVENLQISTIRTSQVKYISHDQSFTMYVIHQETKLCCILVNVWWRALSCTGLIACSVMGSFVWLWTTPTHGELKYHKHWSSNCFGTRKYSAQEWKGFAFKKDAWS